jgi:hypothetical protein
VVISAWGWQESLESADGPRLEQLVQEHRNSTDAPEPGGSCEVQTSGSRAVPATLSHSPPETCRPS